MRDRFNGHEAGAMVGHLYTKVNHAAHDGSRRLSLCAHRRRHGLASACRSVAGVWGAPVKMPAHRAKQ
jgi:hypothetical protein